MVIYGVDPGCDESAFVVWDTERGKIHDYGIAENATVLQRISGLDCGPSAIAVRRAVLVVESIESYGMPVGIEVFRTVWWSGRFHQAWNGEAYQLPRRAVKAHLCHSARATDANIRQALIDRFGPTKAEAVGSKKQPGPLYGLKSHTLAALAVALTWADQHVKAATGAA